MKRITTTEARKLIQDAGLLVSDYTLSSTEKRLMVKRREVSAALTIEGTFENGLVSERALKRMIAWVKVAE